jgi:transcription antitermination factor NusG
MTTHRGEEEAKSGHLTKLLSRETGIKADDIYVPILRSGTTRPLFLVEGYLFIKSGYPASSYMDAARTPFIEKLITQFDVKSGMISHGTVSDRELKKMISRATELGGKYAIGDVVEISNGEFKGCVGEIIDIYMKRSEMEDVEMYSILLTFRSAEVILNLDVFSIGEKKDGR